MKWTQNVTLKNSEVLSKYSAKLSADILVSNKYEQGQTLLGS